jgi:biopolymer transport protein ExbD
MNRRQRRDERADSRRGRAVAINIVSLIDVFAILVFYLLVNALAVETIPSPRTLKLPESITREQPRSTLAIVITRDEILVGNRKVMTTAQAAGGKSLAPLRSALLQLPLDTEERGTPSRGDANILADRSIPFGLLKSVMSTCSEVNFARISLAVVEGRGGAT